MTAVGDSAIHQLLADSRPIDVDCDLLTQAKSALILQRDEEGLGRRVSQPFPFRRVKQGQPERLIYRNKWQ
jgi:hypothetical protein